MRSMPAGRPATGPGPSPYPWRDTLRWPAAWIRPSIRARASLTPRPAHHRFHLSPTRTVRLLFVGDLMCMGSDRVPEVCSELRDLVRRADLVVGNCEAPVVGCFLRPDARYLFRFRMAEAYLATLLDRLGVETRRCVLSVANNHIGDQGTAGLSETLRRLRGLGITPIGVRAGSDPSIRLEAGGVRLGRQLFDFLEEPSSHR